MEKRITIFTPTYNRKYILPKLYESLCCQECKDFVWLIVDDGSNDGTEEQVRQWTAEGIVDIEYHYQENKGKMAAHNEGVRQCTTGLFVCIDSDDFLASPQVIGDTLDYWDKNSNLAQQETTSGMVSYRKMVSKEQGYFPENLKLSTLSALYDAGYKGETTLVYKTEVLRLFPFPVIEGEKFITEAYIYDQLDQHYKMLVFPYFSQVCEYLPDGFSSNGWDVLFKNPKGYRKYYNQCIRLHRGNRSYNMRMYIACSLIAGDGRMFAESDFIPLLLLKFPLGLYQYYRLRNRKW